MVDTLPTSDASGPNTGSRHPAQANWKPLTFLRQNHPTGLVLASLLAIVTLPKLPLSKVSSGPKPCVTFATNSSVLTSKGDSPRLQPRRTGTQAPLLLCESFLFLCFSPPPPLPVFLSFFFLPAPELCHQAFNKPRSTSAPPTLASREA